MLPNKRPSVQCDMTTTQCHLHQYGGRDLESEEHLGFIQPEWPHILIWTMSNHAEQKHSALSKKCASSVGSHSHASQFSPGAGSVGRIPPVPPIPSMYRQDTTDDPGQSSVAMGLEPSQGSIRSSHSRRAGTNPGPQQQAWSSSPVKSLSRSSSSLRLRLLLPVDLGSSMALAQDLLPEPMDLVWALSYKVAGKYDIYPNFSSAIHATYVSICCFHWYLFRRATKY
jgi:hypothetical protein